MTSPQETNPHGRDGERTEPRNRVHNARAAEASPDAGGAHAANAVEADRTDRDAHARDRGSSDEGSHVAMVADRRSVVDREKKRYGGIKWGSAFFGWITATGAAVILTALLIAAGTAVGLNTSIGDTADQAAKQPATIGVGGAIALLVVLLVAYFGGGYVAGRMARFNGVKQGVAVWIWAIVIAVVVAVAGKVLGDKYDVLAKLGGFPRLPFSHGDVTTAAVVALIIAVVATLVGAVLGGLAGMRFHRKVDRAGLGA
jgi:amino acid transporter